MLVLVLCAGVGVLCAGVGVVCAGVGVLCAGVGVLCVGVGVPMLVWECCVLVCYMLCVPTLCCSSLYADLLGSQQRAHIKKFAAESFAYLMRKVRLVCNHLHKNVNCV